MEEEEERMEVCRVACTVACTGLQGEEGWGRRREEGMGHYQEGHSSLGIEP